MKRIRLVLAFLLLAGTVGWVAGSASAQAQGITPQGVKPGVLEATALNRSGTYCHLKFPAIVPATLNSDKPQLKDPSAGDIVDFYGPCDHDPVGYDEVCRQRTQNSSTWQREFCD